MLPLALIISLVAWTVFAMIAAGLVFWAVRWFPRQRWLAPTLLILFVLLGMLARTSKWAVPGLVLLLMVASGFIPTRKR
jgi:hypothetical protein